MFMSNALEMMNKQQALSDDRFFKLEEARLDRELTIEEKRHKDDKDHELIMMQMMGNISSQIAGNIGMLAVGAAQNNLGNQRQPINVQPTNQTNNDRINCNGEDSP